MTAWTPPTHSCAKSLLPGGSGLRASQYWTGRALVRQLSHCAPAWFVYHVIDPLWRAPTWTAGLGGCTRAVRVFRQSRNKEVAIGNKTLKPSPLRFERL